MVDIVLIGRVPSKKNSKNVMCIAGRPRVLNSKDFEAWHDGALWELKSQLPRGIALPIVPNKVVFTLFWKDRRWIGDLSNKFESIADLLVDAGVIADDNFEIMRHTEQVFGGFGEYRAEIKIT
jgi:hypothetical protein